MHVLERPAHLQITSAFYFTKHGTKHVLSPQQKALGALQRQDEDVEAWSDSMYSVCVPIYYNDSLDRGSIVILLHDMLLHDVHTPLGMICIESCRPRFHARSAARSPGCDC